MRLTVTLSILTALVVATAFAPSAAAGPEDCVAADFYTQGQNGVGAGFTDPNGNGSSDGDGFTGVYAYQAIYLPVGVWAGYDFHACPIT